MSADIELKLALSPKQLARLRSHALLRGYARAGGGNRTKLVKTYYDTPRLALHAHALTLGVEQAGLRKRQTLIASGAASPLIETEVDGDALVPRRIADRRWRKLLNHNTRDGKLVPVFTAEIARSRMPLQVQGSMIDLAFETGRIRADGREEPICEATLELVAGQPARLYQLALDLHDAVPFHLEHRDPVMRGYGMVRKMPPVAVKAGEVEIEPAATVGAAFHALARAGLDHLCANEAGVLGGDPEAVHQMRVAARRLRALLAAFRSVLDPDSAASLRGELKWLQQQLGAARDWDVFLHTTLEPLTARLHEEPSLDVLRGVAEDARNQAYVVACEALRDRRYTRLLLRFHLWLDATPWDTAAAESPLGGPVTPFAARILHKRCRRLTKLAGRFADLNEREMHEVRLRAKKLRYAAEFFRPFYAPKDTKKFIRTLIEIQDTLGTLHDAIVGRELMTRLPVPVPVSATNGPGTAPRTAGLERAIGVAAGFQAARIADDIRRFGEVWPRFAKLRKFWRAT